MFPDYSLRADERVVVHERPAPMAVLRDAAVRFAGLVLIAGSVAAVGFGGWWLMVALIALAAFATAFFIGSWRGSGYVITNERLLFRVAGWRRRQWTIELADIDDVWREPADARQDEVIHVEFAAGRGHWTIRRLDSPRDFFTALVMLASPRRERLAVWR